MDERAERRDDRAARLGAVIVIAVLTLLVAGGVFWFSSSMLTGEAQAQCGASGVMKPGDQCENIRSGAVQSYSERLDGEQTARNAIGWVAVIAGIGVIVVGAIMMRSAWTEQRPDAGSPPKPTD
jgi:hypothetical protein